MRYQVSNRVFWAGVVLAASAIISSSSRGGPDQVEFGTVAVKKLVVLGEDKKPRVTVGVSGDCGYIGLSSNSRLEQNCLLLGAAPVSGGYVNVANGKHERFLTVEGLNSPTNIRLEDEKK